MTSVTEDVPCSVPVTAAEQAAYACGDLTPCEVAAGQTTPTCGVTNPNDQRTHSPGSGVNGLTGADGASGGAGGANGGAGGAAGPVAEEAGRCGRTRPVGVAVRVRPRWPSPAVTPDRSSSSACCCSWPGGSLGGGCCGRRPTGSRSRSEPSIAGQGPSARRRRHAGDRAGAVAGGSGLGGPGRGCGHAARARCRARAGASSPCHAPADRRCGGAPRRSLRLVTSPTTSARSATSSAAGRTISPRTSPSPSGPSPRAEAATAKKPTVAASSIVPFAATPVALGTLVTDNSDWTGGATISPARTSVPTST